MTVRSGRWMALAVSSPGSGTDERGGQTERSRHNQEGAVEGRDTLTTGKLTGRLLLLGATSSLIGVLMFWARSGQTRKPAPSFAYYATE